MKADKSSHTPVVDHLEAIAIAVVDASSHVAIEVLDQTQKTLDHAELLARRLVNIKQRVDKFSDESRQIFKQQALEICRDSSEIGSEAVRQAAQVIRTLVDETREIGTSSESLLKDLIEPALELPNPFRKHQANARKKSKEPTIIPISIQDN